VRPSPVTTDVVKSERREKKPSIDSIFRSLKGNWREATLFFLDSHSLSLSLSHAHVRVSPSLSVRREPPSQLSAAAEDKNCETSLERSLRSRKKLLSFLKKGIDFAAFSFVSLRGAFDPTERPLSFSSAFS